MKKKQTAVFVLMLTFLLAAGGCAPDGRDEAEESRSYAGTDASSQEEQEENIFLREPDVPEVEFQQVSLPEGDLELRYYYRLLSEEEQLTYRELVQGIREQREKIVTHGSDPDQVNRIFLQVCLDYPEFFWLSGGVETTSYTGPAEYSEVRPVYTVTEEERGAKSAAVEEGVASYLSAMPEGLGEYERIRWIFDELVNRTDYVADAPDNQNICSVFIGGQSVCAGYSRAFQYLMNRLGVECIYVSGTDAQQAPHAWNIVLCQGAYYNVDVTWGDPVFAASEAGGDEVPPDMTYYDFLCCSDGEFRDSHTPDADLEIPACTQSDLEYYRQIGRYYESLGREEMLQVLEGDIDAGLARSELKFSGAESYAAAQGFLEEVLAEAAGYLGERYGLSQVYYQYTQDDTTYKIVAFWNYTEA